MKKILCFIVAIIYFFIGIKSANSDPNPCALVEGGKKVTSYEKYSTSSGIFFCTTPGGGDTIRHYDSELLAVQISILNGIHSELKNMKSSVDGLTSAVNELKKANNELVSKNKEWQSNTLNTAINKIEKIPQTVLTNSKLIETLTTQVSYNLISDPAFLAKLKSGNNP
jgi:hypothetical protein